MSDAIRSLLVEAQRDAYHAHNAQIEELSNNRTIPVEVVTRLVEERDFVFDELQKRIDSLTV